MDKSEIESNASNSLDSLQSDVSSLLGLSSYGAEFAELRHLVNGSEHYESASAPRDSLASEYEQTITRLESNLKDSQKFNANYIQKLVKTNTQLEEELENANKQIERLIVNYRSKHDFKDVQSKFDLEIHNYHLNLHYSKLEKQLAEVQQERDTLNAENVHLRVSLEECTLERNIKQKSINCLKEKIGELHTANQNLLNEISNLKLTQTLLNTRLLNLYKSRIWYKKQLSVCQHTRASLHEELVTSKSEIKNYSNHISNLNIELKKLNIEIEEASKQTKETEDVACNTLINNAPQENVHLQAIKELEEEIVQITTAKLDKDNYIDELKSANSALIANQCSLETSMKQKDLDIKLLLCSKQDMLSQLECLRAKCKEQLSENEQLQSRLLTLEVQLQNRNKEKEGVETALQHIRDQFRGLTNIYEKLKNDMRLNNAELEKLREDNREVMGNWTACKSGHKTLEILTASLRKEKESCVTKIEELEDKLRHVEDENATNSQEERKRKVNQIKKQLSQKEAIIHDAPEIKLTNCLRKLENEISSSRKDIPYPESTMGNSSQSYLERITDDQKVELLFKRKPFLDTSQFDLNLLPLNNSSSYIENYTEKLNIDGLEMINMYRRRLDREAKTTQSQKSTIKELQILLQVKDREIQEKQKKTDRNNRILLRKVKEHMRGRNAAEKQLKHLQELYNNIAWEYNAAKMVLSLRDSEMKALRKVCADYEINDEKQISSILLLEYQLKKMQICAKCIKSQEHIKCMEAELTQIRRDVEFLQFKDTELQDKISSQQTEIATLRTERDDYEAKLINQEDIKRTNVQQEELLEKLQTQLLNADKYAELNIKLTEDLAEASKANSTLSNQIQAHSSNFHRTAEYCQELERKLVALEEQLLEETKNSQKLTSNYKSTIQGLQKSVQVLNNDRVFFQRISRDLKLAFGSCMERNKKLQEQLKSFGTDNHFLKRRSMPLDDNLPLGNFNETYINQLLQTCSDSLGNKEVAGDIQGHLSGLRDEILNLQRQILKRNKAERN